MASSVEAWFLGPHAENAACERALVSRILEDYFAWRRGGAPERPEELNSEAAAFRERLSDKLNDLLAGLRRHYPFHSPRYNAHMISDQTLPSVLGYFAGLLYNPNNVTPESSPVTIGWELEVGRDILAMLGFTPPPADGKPTAEEFGWAHVTSGGTVANLEALWVARNVRYFPLAVRDACLRHRIDLKVARLTPRACLGIPPREAIELYGRFIDAVHRHWDLARSEAIRAAHELLAESRYSIAHHGTAQAYAVLPPVLVVSGARHYSITKAADILGIGRGNVVLVDTDARFRMDPRDLAAKLRAVHESHWLPVAVIGVAGTTEEGAVDPIHRVVALRQALEAEGRSFWLHVDGAWGGYLRALFRDGTRSMTVAPRAPSGAGGRPEARQSWSALDDDFDTVRRFVSGVCQVNDQQQVPLEWSDPEVHAAFRAVPQADSVTVDPHKLGYVPYPCGVAAYRNDLVRQFLTEEIPYISTAHYEDVDARRHRPPDSVGPYILEGSKPGAAVAACWLSHRLIPLDRTGHGQILRVSLLAARELYERLIRWRAPSYRLIPVSDQAPDTNVVCFLVQPNPSRGLAATNALNRELHRRFTAADATFFLSRTVFQPDSYSCEGISALLERAGIDPGEYRLHGLFVLRATVMSPYHGMEAESRTLFEQFLKQLDSEVRCALK